MKFDNERQRVVAAAALGEAIIAAVQGRKEDKREITKDEKSAVLAYGDFLATTLPSLELFEEKEETLAVLLALAECLKVAEVAA